MSGGKTEEPTPRRLRRALEEGDSGASAFASQAVALVVAIALLPAAVAAAAARVEERLRQAIAVAASHEPRLGFDAARVAGDIVALSLPVLAGVAIAAAASTIVQTGGFLGFRRLAPKLERLDLLQGIRGLVSRVRLFAVARALVGGALVGGLVVHALRAHAIDLVRTAGRVAYAGPAAAAIAKTIAWDAAAVGVALAAVDLVVMRLDRRRRLRMSKDEVARERKESEGDPLVKAERARAREELLVGGAALDVRRASVVVRDGTEATVACALRWDETRGDRAPVVVAAGDGGLAGAIVRGAMEYGVATVEREALARALAAVPVGEEIPQALYEDVAEILREVSDAESARLTRP